MFLECLANFLMNFSECLKRPVFNILNVKDVAVVCFQIKSNHFYCHITTAQVPW